MIILASNSPRRRSLLESVGLVFSVVPANIDESAVKPMRPDETVMEISRRKALCVYNQTSNREDMVIAADTLVYCEGKMLGKPSSPAEAEDMLRFLSGRTHRVYTGMTVITDGQIKTVCSYADVTFRVISEAEIKWYVSTGEPLDKAGAYGIQERGGIFVSGISGDYYAILGLSLYDLFNITGIGIL